MNSDMSETDRIEHDLAETRERLDLRLGALQEKMAPAQIVNDTFAHLGGDDGAAFTGRLIEKTKANPLAVGLVGLGFAWLIATKESRSSALSADSDELSTRLRFAEGKVARGHDEHDEAYSERLSAARGLVLGIERRPDEDARSYSDRIKGAMASARQALREASHDASDRATQSYSGLGAQMGRSAYKLHEGSRNMAKNANLSSLASNPIALGGLAAVAGLVVGALLPTSGAEERAFGSTAGKLKAAASDAAQDLADKGGEVVNQALETARESAAREGLTADRPIG